MGNENSRDTGLALDASDLLPGLKSQPGVKVRERFVEEQHARHLYEGAGDRDALLLAARELARLAVKKLVQLNELCGFDRSLQHFVL